MSSDLESFLHFLEDQKKRQAPLFPDLRFDKVLSFMGTTSLAGTHAAVSVNRVRKLEPGPTGRELRITLAGPLARAPRRGECLTVHLTRPEHYQGFQVKTRALAVGLAEAELVEAGPEGLTVKGASIYTVHQGPYTLKFFENVPFEEVQAIVGSVPCALVGIGETANLSPRFVFHHEVRDGKLELFHGDGLALKTYMNLKSNPQETRLVLDLASYEGFALQGTVEEFAPHQHPVAFDRICRGFGAGNWGKPSRVFRFTAEQIERVKPVG